ncbi:hypothetical protein GE061_007346 [Apolygus lucorum]|uniref:Uncharacterized protein n=1 Tax=Apolygus lucorum TaxID=248454 RepID=A0A8S9WQX2_APOLU|nr:hypothetical protein GE061_007346 [Apolygus lucorum]
MLRPTAAEICSYATESHQDASISGNENPEILSFPNHIHPPFDYTEIQRDSCGRNYPSHTSYDQIASSTNSIPYHLLVQLGLAKPNRIKSHVENRAKYLKYDVEEAHKWRATSNSDNFGFVEAAKPRSNVFGTYQQPILAPRQFYGPEKIITRTSLSRNSQERFSLSRVEPDNQISPSANDIPHNLLVEMGLKPCLEEPKVKGNFRMVEIGDLRENSEAGDGLPRHQIPQSVPREYLENRRQIEESSLLVFQESHDSLSQLFLTQELPNTNEKCTDAKNCCSEEAKTCVHVGIKIMNEEGVPASIETHPKTGVIVGEKDVACSDGLTMENNKHLESQSSLSQLFQSEEFDEAHYRDMMSIGVVLKPDDSNRSKELLTNSSELTLDDEKDTENIHDDFQSDLGNSTKAKIVESRELIAKEDRVVQPFVIKGCEPKMFDTSIKLEGDNPWKSEVRLGVLDPTEEVSNRGKVELEEIPMVVSPYFSNEFNHPVQNDKRTSLYHSTKDSLTVSLSQDGSDVFSQMFEQESTDELKLCKDFFKQNISSKTTSAQKTKVKSSKTKSCESKKITSYFPVIKNPSLENESQYDDRMLSKRAEEHDVPMIQVTDVSSAQVKPPLQEQGNSRKRKKPDSKLEEPRYNRIAVSTLRKKKSHEIFPEDDIKVSCDSKFEDLGAGFVQYKLPSKHVFEDLPPGTVQSMSQLKPVGLDRKTSDVIPSSSPRTDTNREKITDFHRAAVQNTHQKWEIRILEEAQVENTALELESSGDLTEIGFTLCYKEKYSVLNRPQGIERKLHHPAGVMSRVEFAGGKIIRIYQSVNELTKENSRSFLLCLLESNCRKVCFESQAFIMFVLEALIEADDRTCNDWLLLDPIVGMWLLNPDYPPHSFNCVLKEFNIKVDITHPTTAWKETVGHYMDALSQIIERLHGKLDRLNLWDVFYSMETHLTPILAAMEMRSIEVNFAQLKNISKVLQDKLKSIEQSAWTLLGKKFQLSSPLQLRTILYDELKLDELGAVKVKCTESGAKSTDEGTVLSSSSCSLEVLKKSEVVRSVIPRVSRQVSGGPSLGRLTLSYT